MDLLDKVSLDDNKISCELETNGKKIINDKKKRDKE